TDEYRVWPLIKANFYRRLPLRNDVDVDRYKNVIKPRIQAWLNSKARPRRDEEWMIAYVGTDSEMLQTAASRILSIKTTVFERVRSDFQPKNTSRRVVMLDPHNAAGWADMFAAIKELVVSSMEAQFASLDGDIRRLDSNRLVPGWNYCRFFILKEGLVSLYTVMGLYGEALKQYDELDAVFSQIMDAKALSWFNKIGGTEHGDDFTDLLNTNKKPYRKFMVENKIPLFDFLIYLFGRQCVLLLKMGRRLELLKRARRFVMLFLQTIRDIDTGLPLGFVSAWAFNTCMNIVNIVEGVPTSAVKSGSSPSVEELAICKAEFLNHARYQLLVLGILTGRLPQNYLVDTHVFVEIPFPFPLVFSQPIMTDLEYITNPELTEILSSKEAFDRNFVRIARQAISYYGENDKRSIERMLIGDIVRLHTLRGRYNEALALLRPIVPTYDPRSWQPVYTEWLKYLAECEKGRGNRVAHISSLMVLLLVSSERMRARYLSEFVEAAASVELPGPKFVEAPLFLGWQVEVVTEPGKYCVLVTVHSSMPAPVEAQDVSVWLARAHSGLSVRFYEQSVAIQPGINSLRLRCKSASCPGFFVPQRLEIRIGNVRLVYPNKFEREAMPLVRLGTRPGSLYAEACPSSTVTLDAEGGGCAVVLRVEARDQTVKGGIICMLDQNAVPLFGKNSVLTAIERNGVLSESLPHALPRGISSDGSIVLEAMEPGDVVAYHIDIGRTDYPAKTIHTYVEYQALGDGECMFSGSHVVDFKPPFQVEFETRVLRGREVVKATVYHNSKLPLVGLKPQAPTMKNLDVVVLPHVHRDYGANGVGTVYTLLFELASRTGTVQSDTAAKGPSLVPIAMSYSNSIEAIDGCVDSLKGHLRRGLARLLERHGVLYIQDYLERLVIYHVLRSMTVELCNEAAVSVRFAPFDEQIRRALVCEPASARRSVFKVLDEFYESMGGGGSMSVGQDALPLKHDRSQGRSQIVLNYQAMSTVAAELSVAVPCDQPCYVGELANVTITISPFVLWRRDGRQTSMASMPPAKSGTAHDDDSDDDDDSSLDIIVHVNSGHGEQQALVFVPPLTKLRVKPGQSTQLVVGVTPLHPGPFPLPKVSCEWFDSSTSSGHAESGNSLRGDSTPQSSDSGDGGVWRPLWVAYADSQELPTVLPHPYQDEDL
ncbi:hypothetical protein EV182_000549, partial [Spiromyces aspiralis]